jgi:putative transposase
MFSDSGLRCKDLRSRHRQPTAELGNGDIPYFCSIRSISHRTRVGDALHSACMPRTSRAIVGGHCYHLINRGNNRSRIFHETADYAAFIALMREASERIDLPILATCLMPNHLHLVVQPRSDGDLARWTHWLFTTHVSRYHRKHQSSGRVWQGRFKAFAIEQDDHLLTVLRYVERNSLRAGLVDRAEQWLWGSLRWRDSPSPPVQLQPPPISLPSDWIDYVNRAQTVAELDAIRTSVNRQRPFGSPAWVQRQARELGLVQSLRSVGRPARKRAPDVK